MKINIVDVNKVVADNNLPEITSASFFLRNMIPDPEGLFSNEIFGIPGSKERYLNIAYIDLHGHYIQPLAYKALISLNRKIEKIISGDMFARINSRGEIIEDETNGSTGIDWLYNNWEKLKWKMTNSNKRANKIKLLKSLDKDVIFCSKWLVLPAGLRDYNVASTSGRVSDSSPVNSMYSSLIRNSQSIENLNMSFTVTSTQYNIQKTLVEIYNFYTKQIKGKTGLLHKAVMGKTIDYATRSVISSPKMQQQSYKDLQIPFGYAGIPLSQLCVLFFPFFNKWIYDFILTHIEQIKTVVDGRGREKVLEEEIVLRQFDNDAIKKLLNSYIKNIEGRFNTLTITDENGVKYPLNIYRKELGRNFTLTDLLFIASNDICKDKHCMMTRYPIENINNIMPVKIKVISTRDTIPEMHLEDFNLRDYPVIIPDYPIADEPTSFIDTIVINTMYCKMMGADFDGGLRFLQTSIDL